MKLRLLIVLASLAGLVALPLSRSATRPSAADAATISIVDFAFQPANVTVDVGATVTWTHNGSAPHTTTSETGLWDSGMLSAAQSFAFTFNTPGTFRFFCDFHSGMTGTITVTRPIYLPIVLHNSAGSPIDLTATSEAATQTAEAGATPTNEPGQSYGLQGAVHVRPRWTSVTTPDQPVAYEIILDTSGSMIWNFAGQTGSSSNPIQCTGAAWHNDCYNGWSPVEERRIYIAKQAISGFIDQMRADDTMRIISSSGALTSNYSEQRAISLLTKAWPTNGWSSDKAVLMQALTSAGAFNNDPYFTRGATPNATGFAFGRQVLAGAPPTAPDGRPYRRVVIFLTDGVANVFLDGEMSSGQDVCPGEPGASETARCQVGVTSTGRLRPVTATADQANRMKQDDPTVTIYVVVLADTDTTGLSLVASTPSFLYEASQPEDLGPALDLIQADVRSATCKPVGGYEWLDQVDAQNTPDFPSPDNLPPGVFGYVYLYDQNGNPLPTGQHQLPITHDPATGRLTFTLPTSQGLAPGTYQIGAFAGYKGGDTRSRLYDWIIDQNTLMGAASRTFTITGNGGPVIVIDPLQLDLRPAVQLCP